MSDDGSRRRYRKHEPRMVTLTPKEESSGPPRWAWAIAIVLGGLLVFGALGALVGGDDEGTSVSAPNSQPVRAVAPASASGASARASSKSPATSATTDPEQGKTRRRW